MSTQTLLALPYPEIEATASRDKRREFMKPDGEMYRCPFSLIKVRENFNGRIPLPGLTHAEYIDQELKIPELAENIAANGLEQRIEGDMLINGTFILNAGHRRLMAIEQLIAEDRADQFKDKNGIYMIPVICNPPGTTELERMRRMDNENAGIPFRPVERALILLRMKETQGSSNDELKHIYSKSRQWVDDMITLAKLPEDIRNKVEIGEIGWTVAVAEFRATKKEKKNEEGFTLPEDLMAILGKNDAFKIPPIPPAVTHTLGSSDKDLSATLINAGYDKPENEFEAYKVAMHILHTYAASSSPEERTFEEMTLTANLLTLTAAFEEQMLRLTEEQQAELYSPGQDLEAPAFKPFVPIRYDSESVHEQESEINDKGTDRKVKTKEPKREKEDALGDIDFSKDKEEGEFELNEVVKLLDKIVVKMDMFPKEQAQYVKDIQGLAVFCQNKVKTAIEILKKASDKR